MAKKNKNQSIIGIFALILVLIGIILLIFNFIGEKERTKYYFTELDVVLDCEIYSSSSSYKFKCYQNGEEIEIYSNSFIKLEDYEKIQEIKLK